MSTQKRNIWLDNVKGFLIICVVAGHFLESGIDYHSNMCKSLFLFIYSFHMPLFVFASGLMCEHAIQTKERFCKKLANFAGLYVLLKLLIFPFQRLTSPGLTFSLVKTDGVPWYLFAMCVFYTCAYLLRHVDKRKILAIAVLAALLAGYDNGCICFFPVSCILPMVCARVDVQCEQIRIPASPSGYADSCTGDRPCIFYYLPFKY